MDKTTKKEEVDIHCACAMGDLSEFAPVKTVTKKTKEIQKEDVIKEESKKETKNDVEEEILDNKK